jgi:hypothetical protein
MEQGVRAYQAEFGNVSQGVPVLDRPAQDDRHARAEAAGRVIRLTQQAAVEFVSPADFVAAETSRIGESSCGFWTLSAPCSF